MVKTVRNHHIVHLVYLSQIQVVGDKGMQGCLRVLPRVHNRTLGYTNGIFGKHLAKQNQKSAVISNFPIFKLAL